MGNILVVHRGFRTLAGKQAVCFNILDALQADHDVTLVTATPPTSIQAGNDQYRTGVTSAVTVRSADRIRTIADGIETALTRALGPNSAYPRLHDALLTRWARLRRRNYDLLIHTSSEAAIGKPGLTYGHAPLFNQRFAEGDQATVNNKQAAFDYLLSFIAGIADRELDTTRLLVNSEWTKRQYRSAYPDAEIDVLYPPIITDDLGGVPWEDREQGFVAVGRLSPDKEPQKLVRIIDDLHQTDERIHLHLVGDAPAVKERDKAYLAELQEMAASRDYVQLEGRLNRQELAELMNTHRYAIHAKSNEHFGIAVAEFVAAGMIPFVPDGGGQVEIVARDDRLVYASEDDAVDKIQTITQKEIDPEAVRRDLPDAEQRYGQERFQVAIREQVENIVK